MISRPLASAPASSQERVPACLVSFSSCLISFSYISLSPPDSRGNKRKGAHLECQEVSGSVRKCQEKAGLLWESWAQAASPPRWSRPGWRREQLGLGLLLPARPCSTQGHPLSHLRILYLNSVGRKMWGM